MTKTCMPLIYAVSTRYGVAEYTNKRDATRAARAEVTDGWPSSVRDMRTDATVWEAKI